MRCIVLLRRHDSRVLSWHRTECTIYGHACEGDSGDGEGSTARSERYRDSSQHVLRDGAEESLQVSPVELI